jgi:(R,R)-butanediol dehydrogenase/meso-butanediol dehydrogenase/diacetyl reductase
VRALVNRGPHDFRIEEVPDPRPGPGELLVRPLFTGVCITDKHVYEGRGFGNRWAEGLVMGHEFAGVVHETPADMDGWTVGDRVAVDPRIYCNECLNCRGGYVTLCERGARWLGVGDGRGGGYAELCAVPAYACYRLPDAVSDELGSVVEPAACATRGVRLSGFAHGDNVVILGAEDYGLLILQQLSQVAGEVIVVDPSQIRRDAALGLGATHVVDPAAGSAGREIRQVLPRGADLVFV